MNRLLEVESLTLRFGGITALDQVSFYIAPGRIAALIGPNGAGKTSLFNCITGFYRPTSGTIRLHQESGPRELQSIAQTEIAATARLARSFQNIRLFGGMTCLENLLVAQYRHHAPGVLPSLLGLPRARAAEALTRGSVQANLTIDRSGALPVVRINAAVLDAIVATLRQLAPKIEASPPTLDGLLGLKGVIEIGDAEEREDERRNAEAAQPLVAFYLSACAKSPRLRNAPSRRRVGGPKPYGPDLPSRSRRSLRSPSASILTGCTRRRS